VKEASSLGCVAPPPSPGWQACSPVWCACTPAMQCVSLGVQVLHLVWTHTSLAQARSEACAEIWYLLWDLALPHLLIVWYSTPCRHALAHLTQAE
jgi:hypothetical protein